MSIWDYMKKTDRPQVPQSIELGARGEVVVRWEDGKTTAVTAHDLRAECPCAGCVDEFTRQRTLDVKTIPADLGVSGMHQVGNYAVSVVFTDGHSSGIYEWGTLRRISEQHPATA